MKRAAGERSSNKDSFLIPNKSTRNISLCGLFTFDFLPNNKNNKTIYLCKKTHYLNSETFEKQILNYKETNLERKYSIDESDFSGPSIYKNALKDCYDNDVLRNDLVTLREKTRLPSLCTNENFLHGNCIFCGLIARTIFLLILNQRLPQYCPTGSLDIDTCPFGVFHDIGEKTLFSKAKMAQHFLIAEGETDDDLNKRDNLWWNRIKIGNQIGGHVHYVREGKDETVFHNDNSYMDGCRETRYVRQDSSPFVCFYVLVHFHYFLDIFQIKQKDSSKFRVSWLGSLCFVSFPLVEYIC